MRGNRVKRKKNGFVVDIAGLENLAVHNHSFLKGPQKNWFIEVLRWLYFKEKSQGDPLSKLIAAEEQPLIDSIVDMTEEWLKKALAELPKNQELCIYLRYRLDGSFDPKKVLRTETEIAEIVGVSQSTVFRNIKGGLRNLKRNYDANLKDTINSIKAQIERE